MIPLTLTISPAGRARLEAAPEETSGGATTASERRIREAFEQSPAAGMLLLATSELRAALSPSLAFARELAHLYLTRLCHRADLDGAGAPAPVPAPSAQELDALAQAAPPMTGLEYLHAGVLSDWWNELDSHVRQAIRAHAGGARAYLRDAHPAWREVGRVTFHLAEVFGIELEAPAAPASSRPAARKRKKTAAAEPAAAAGKARKVARRKATEAAPRAKAKPVRKPAAPAKKGRKSRAAR